MKSKTIGCEQCGRLDASLRVILFKLSSGYIEAVLCRRHRYLRGLRADLDLLGWPWTTRRAFTTLRNTSDQSIPKGLWFIGIWLVEDFIVLGLNLAGGRISMSATAELLEDTAKELKRRMELPEAERAQSASAKFVREADRALREAERQTWK